MGIGILMHFHVIAAQYSFNFFLKTELLTPQINIMSAWENLITHFVDCFTCVSNIFFLLFVKFVLLNVPAKRDNILCFSGMFWYGGEIPGNSDAAWLRLLSFVMSLGWIYFTAGLIIKATIYRIINKPSCIEIPFQNFSSKLISKPGGLE
ncbi:hypothetical protein ACJX0J_008308, partial [Zea mays]